MEWGHSQLQCYTGLNWKILEKQRPLPMPRFNIYYFVKKSVHYIQNYKQKYWNCSFLTIVTNPATDLLHHQKSFLFSWAIFDHFSKFHLNPSLYLLGGGNNNTSWHNLPSVGHCRFLQVDIANWENTLWTQEGDVNGCDRMTFLILLGCVT